MSQFSLTRPTLAEINLDHLAFNLRSVRDFVGHEVKYMAVVKANAYGHGAAHCSVRLESEGVDWFGVAIPEEGVELRQAGITKPILSLGGFWPGQEELVIEHKITPVIFGIENAERFNAAAKQAVDIHVKIDTGMGRVGIPFREAGTFAEMLRRLKRLRVQGLMTHFAAADDLSENPFTQCQIERLNEAVAVFRRHGFDPEYVDMANSPGAIAHPASRGNMVRLGGVLYGLGGDVLPAGIEKPDLRPVMSLKTKVAQIKNVPAGSTLGYARTFTAETDSVIGTIPVGYHDGYRRGLSNQGHVIVNGTFAPVVGRVSMDWTLIDLSNVPPAKLGDEVILIGEQNGLVIKAEEIAASLGTISYEVTCGISARVPRIATDRSE